MLTLFGPRHHYCDGITRRSFLKIGGLALGGLSLPELLRAETAAGHGPGRSHKAVIMVYLSGGLAHQDTFDLKPEAPEEIRGEFRPIATKIPGVQVGELLPRMAGVLDKVAVLRSVIGQARRAFKLPEPHRFSDGAERARGKPHFSSVVYTSRCRAGTRSLPPFIDLFPVMQHKPYNTPGPGWLRPDTSPVARMDGDDLVLLKQQAVTPERFAGRRQLLTQFDHFRSAVDAAEIGGMENVYQRAFEVLTTSRVARALDLEREDPKVRARYGSGLPKHLGDGAPRSGTTSS